MSRAILSRGLIAAGFVLAFVAGGCAHDRVGSRPPGDLLGGGQWLLASRVSFAPQTGSKGCGPAALAMVLDAWGVAAPAGVGQGPANRGVTAGELRDAARARGLVAFAFPGTPADLVAELEAGHPVLLGLARRKGLYRYSHFVVVVGRDSVAGRWLLADPDRGWRTVRDGDLLEQWTAAGRATVVVFPATPAPLANPA